MCGLLCNCAVCVYCVCFEFVVCSASVFALCVLVVFARVSVFVPARCESLRFPQLSPLSSTSAFVFAFVRFSREISAVAFCDCAFEKSACSPLRSIIVIEWSITYFYYFRFAQGL